MQRHSIFHTAAAALVLAAALSAPAGAQRPTRLPLTAAQRSLQAAVPTWQPAVPLEASALPASVDNSRSKYFPAIFTQGSNNACSQASGVRYVYSYEVNRQLDRDAASPEAVFGYHFTWNFLNEGDNQGSHAFLGYELMKDCGTLPLSLYDDQAYSFAQQTQWPTGIALYTAAMENRVESYAKFSLKTREGIDRLRRYLADHGDGSATGGVVSISCYTDDWGLRAYDGPAQTGLRHIVTREGTDGPHAITVTGYDDTVEYDFDGDGQISDDERGAFIFANSWDDYWGSDGRCYMPYSVVLASPLAGGLTEGNAEAYSVVPRLDAPRYVFRVSLTYSRRNELSFVLGAADGSEARMPAVDFTYPIMNRQGGAYPMQGRDASGDMDVAFCFDRYADRVSGYEEPRFFLTVRRTAATGTGQIASFSVVDLATGTEYVCPQHDVALTGGQVVLTTAASRSVYPSCSPWRWLRPGTSAPYASPFVMRTAKGTPMKMKINGYDPASGRLTLKYRRL